MIATFWLAARIFRNTDQKQFKRILSSIAQTGANDGTSTIGDLKAWRSQVGDTIRDA